MAEKIQINKNQVAYIISEKEIEKEQLKKDYKVLKESKGKPTKLADVVERLELLEKINGL